MHVLWQLLCNSCTQVTCLCMLCGCCFAVHVKDFNDSNVTGLRVLCGSWFVIHVLVSLNFSRSCLNLWNCINGHQQSFNMS